MKLVVCSIFLLSVAVAIFGDTIEADSQPHPAVARKYDFPNLQGSLGPILQNLIGDAGQITLPLPSGNLNISFTPFGQDGSGVGFPGGLFGGANVNVSGLLGSLLGGGSGGGLLGGLLGGGSGGGLLNGVGNLVSGLLDSVSGLLCQLLGGLLGGGSSGGLLGGLLGKCNGSSSSLLGGVSGGTLLGGVGNTVSRLLEDVLSFVCRLLSQLLGVRCSDGFLGLSRLSSGGPGGLPVIVPGGIPWGFNATSPSPTPFTMSCRRGRKGNRSGKRTLRN